MKKVKVAEVVTKKELVKVEGNSPADLIRTAVSNGANLEQLKGLLDLQEKWEANEARKAYNVAMAEFKANPPKIDKNKTVSFGNTKYNHASLANVTEKIGVELSKHGLSASWSTKQNGAILVTCRITHIKGHSEETTLSAPSDTSGSKNAIQAIGSTITYLERYTLLSLTGLATYDQDDDGVASGAKPIKEAKEVSMPQSTKKVTPVQNDALVKIKVNLAKAHKLLGDQEFFKIIGNEGFTTIEEINNIAIATQILRDMEDVYKSREKKE